MRLGNIDYFKSRYNCNVGFSDHSQGLETALQAQRRGAVMFEKHVTTDKTQDGPDHPFAMEFDELAIYVKQLQANCGGVSRDPEASTDYINITPREEKNRAWYLKSIVARRNLIAGEIIQKDDVYLVRPGSGIEPSGLSRVVGGCLRASVEAGTPLQWTDVDVLD